MSALVDLPGISPSLLAPVILPPEHVKRAAAAGLRPAQYTVFVHPARFRVLCAGRRVGKSRLIVHELCRAAQSKQGAMIVYIAPTFRMAKQIMWKELKQAIPPAAIKVKNETELSITLKGFDSTIMLFGAENPDGMRGLTLDFAAFDEFQDIALDVWELVIRPALSSTMGDAIFCGTPKGRNWFYDLFQKGDDPDEPDWASFSFSTIQGGNVPAEEILAAFRSMSRQAFEQEFLASFLLPEGRIYSNFTRERNVRSDLADLKGDILVGMDFNVDPMTAVFAVKAADQIHVIGELEIMNSHTAEMAEEIRRRFPGRRVTVFPDPSGKARKTSAGGRTDFAILRDAGFSVVAPAKAPLVRDRINTVQAALRTAGGESRLLIHPRCKAIVKALEGLAYQPGTNVPDKSSGLDHIVDALGYLVCHELPLRRARIGVGVVSGA